MTISLALAAANNATWQFGPLDLLDTEANAPLALPAGTVIAMQLRAAADSVELVLDLSTTNGLLIADAVASKVRGFVPLAKMSAIAAGSYDYDIVVSLPTGSAIRTYEGTVTVKQSVTC